MASYWVIMHGDPEAPNLYWCGFDGAKRDHLFERGERGAAFAIRFCREQDALRAGVGLTKGTRIKEMSE